MGIRKITLVLACVFGAIAAKSQCYGVVTFDTSTSAGTVSNAGNTTFTIPTKFGNELILIAYDGWNGPGVGPVTVDGNPATLMATANNGNSGTAETYAYTAPTSGTHTIVCSTSGYNSGYYINMAAAFYATGTCTPLTTANLTDTINTIACTTGGSITGSITTTVAGSMVFTNCEINEGEPTTYPISWTGASFLGNEHTEDGIDAGCGYSPATTVGTYTYTATNSSNPSNGCGGLTLVLTAITPPKCSALTLKDTAVNPTCGKANGSATVTATGGVGPYKYSWTSGGGTSSTATGLSGGSYTVTVTDKNGCVGFDSVKLAFTTSFTVKIASITKVTCNGLSDGGASVTVSGGVLPYTFSWSSGQTTTSVNGLSSATYTLTVSDSTGCSGTTAINIPQPKVLQDTVTLTNHVACTGGNTGSATVGSKGGTGAYTYSWAPGGQTSASATGLSVGVYTITVTDSNGCTSMITDTLKQPPTPKPVITGNDSVCPGNTATLTASGGGTYVWNTGSTNSSISVNPTTATIYSVTVTVGPCSADTTFKVNMYPVPLVTLSGKTSVCPGQSTTLTATGGGTYLWSPGGMTSSSVTVTPGSNTTYSVTVNNAHCTKDTTYTVTIQSPPSVSVSVVSTPACPGTPVTFTANGAGVTSYLWSNGATSSSITVTADTAATYTVVASNGCPDTAKGSLTVFVPTLNVCCDTTIIIGDTVTINGFSAVSYVWTPATSLSCSNCPDPVASPTVTTTYTVTGTDGNGCVSNKEVTVVVECLDFTVPNIFTPNNDGKNDDFVPYYTAGGITHNGVGNVSSYTINVFDRWGKQVYNSNDPTKYWNGTLNNTQYLVPDGTYYYIIKATCGNNNYDHKGFVQVVGGGK